MTKSRAHTGNRVDAGFLIIVGAVFVVSCVGAGLAFSQEEEYESIDSSVCADCHEASAHGSVFAADLSHSVHEGLDCLDCHVDRNTVPHKMLDESFYVGCEGCRTCHDEASEQYDYHGRAERGTCEDTRF